MARSTRSGRFDVAAERPAADMGRELLWFLVHSIAAVALLVIVLGAMTFTHPDPGAETPKQIATALAFAVPLVFAFAICWSRPRDRRLWPARFCWLLGMLALAVVAVRLAELPADPAICAGCTQAQRLWRTLFAFRDGTGLLAGEGLLVGCWIPLSLAGYSAGAALGLRM